MKGTTGILMAILIFVHFMFFLLEAILWMQPEVHTILIGLLDNPVVSNNQLQALTLKNLFINQGFYNLFLVGAGLAGWRFVKAGNTTAGFTLLLFLCVAATGAGIVLACSTKAYLLATLQAVPAAIAFFRLYPSFKNSLRLQKEATY